MMLEGIFEVIVLLGFLVPVLSSHFRGGYITWKPDPDVPNQVSIHKRVIHIILFCFCLFLFLMEK